MLLHYSLMELEKKQKTNKINNKPAEEPTEEKKYNIDEMTKNDIVQELVKKGIEDFNKRDRKDILFERLVK